MLTLKEHTGGFLVCLLFIVGLLSGHYGGEFLFVWLITISSLVCVAFLVTLILKIIYD